MSSRSGNSILPFEVAQFFEATNAGDLTGLLRVFAPDSIVNDQLQEWRGLAAIGRWAECDVLGQQLSLRPVHCIEHYGHCIVTAQADGNFDKRGLPDPLEVHLYFTLAEHKIVQLVVLRDLSGTSRLDDLLRGSY
ncbi:nuclear transport factor 2 family protein [Steroidobacter sp. S1-65]|uniref:Nuclear transport factor 2 family protein n=1 Tax=Steroidobacter gossypii TaxID=2805490 RepID=A0ABS1X1I6_9GAMM|nr:nuclear transport factor 2 family protein [Steroidobacter gossypii]MBM0107062.1 nuclear transport factor 2 family protein [Steroidobacter gossypii]